VTDYETLAARRFTRNPAVDSEVDLLRESNRAEVRSGAHMVSEYPSRRSLRGAAHAGGAHVAVDATPAATPAVPGSRRAAREARMAAEKAAAAAMLAPLPPGVQPVAAVPSAPAVATAAPELAAVLSMPVAPDAAPAFGVVAETAGALVSPDESREVPWALRNRTVQSRALHGRTARPRVAQTRAVRPVAGARKRVSVAGTMVLVGGLFVSVTLPAFASTDYSGGLVDAATASADDSQQLALTAQIAEVAPSAATRDGYEAISAADLKRQYRDALRQKRMAEYLASGAQELGDDYPWATELGMSQGGGLSPLRYFVRQCVDFVAWRLNRDAGSYGYPFMFDWSDLTPGGGNASSWKWQWDVHGWETSTTPAAGWVAWFPGINHVAYVNSVLADGTVLIEEYNWGGRDVYGQRIIDPARAIYLSPPPR